MKPPTLSILSVSLSLSLAQPGSAASPYIYGTDGTVTLASDGVTPDIRIIDFGQNYEGHPVFEVVSASGDTSCFEVSFAESGAAFNNYQSDGPLPLAAAMETFRVKRHNITGPVVHEGRLIQGAFRYQKLNLSTAGELVLQNIGARQTIHTTPLTELPGGFECSDEDLTRIWHTGARSAQLTEIPRDTIPDFWVVTPEGSLVESLAPQPLAGVEASGLLAFDLAFEVKPLTGAFTFSVLMDTLSLGVDVVCDLNQGTIRAVFEQETLASTSNMTVSADGWVSVAARVSMGSVEVDINNATVFSFSQDRRFFGSFGLGTPFAHSAEFRNLVATHPASEGGGLIYASPLTDRSFLDDFLMGGNPLDTIVDASRRDRIAYNGDLDIAIAATFASTYGIEFVQGSLDLMGSFQLTPGFFVPTAKIQQGPQPGIIPANITGLIGYSFNLVTALAQTYMMMGDIAFAQKWATPVTAMLDWADSQVIDGLFTLDDPTFTGDWNYYDPPQTGASAKFNAVYAYALQQSLRLLRDASGDEVAAVYEARLESLRTAMNSRLFDPSLGAYMLSSEVRDGFAQDAQALAILAGVPQATGDDGMAGDILSVMEQELLLPAGPLAFTNSTVSSGFAQKISPYASSYHLRAAFEAGEGAAAMKLLKHLWAPMADPANANYTNSFWETLDPDGTPGLGLVTSHSHGWGAGPTAELNRFVLGVQPVEPGFARWAVKPVTLGLAWARGRQRTERGDVAVDWRFVAEAEDGGLLRMNVTGPSGGVIYLPEPLLVGLNSTDILVNGVVVRGEDFPVEAAGGETVIVQQRRGSGGAGCKAKRRRT